MTPDIVEAEIFKNEDIIFGISTKKGGVSPEPYFMNLSLTVGDSTENVEANRERFYSSLGIDRKRIAYQKQIHSDIIKYVTEPGYAGESDALYTDTANLYLVISTADCVPVFLYEPERKIAAGVHSGWRGTVKNIAGKTVQKLVEAGADASKLKAFIGPGISCDNYEVSKEVAEQFSEASVLSRNEKYYVDIKKEIISQLLSNGVKKDNIEVSDLCTYHEKDLLHSYRRDGEKSGRMFGVIGMKNI